MTNPNLYTFDELEAMGAAEFDATVQDIRRHVDELRVAIARAHRAAASVATTGWVDTGPGSTPARLEDLLADEAQNLQRCALVHESRLVGTCAMFSTALL